MEATVVVFDLVLLIKCPPPFNAQYVVTGKELTTNLVSSLLQFLQVISIVFLQIEIILVRLDTGSIDVYFGLMKAHLCLQMCTLGFIEGRLFKIKLLLILRLPSAIKAQYSKFRQRNIELS